MQKILSKNKKRNNTYLSFLKSFCVTKVQVKDIVRMGHRLMRKAKLHPHFFGNNSLVETAQYLAFYALQLPHEYNNADYLNLKITTQEAEKMIILFERRIAERIPVEYLTHEAYYLGNTFFVNGNVLVPRSIMNTRFKDFLADISWENNHVLDLCAGSGCIGISLALLNPNIKVDLVDISPKALEVASINIQKYSLQDRVQCIQSDLFANIKNKYDLIITNPPYVSTSEYQKSQKEFKNEPQLALESGWDGLDIIHRILAHAKNYLNSEGKIIAEVGFTSAKRLKRRYRQNSFKWLKYRKPNGKIAMLSMDGIFICEQFLVMF